MAENRSDVVADGAVNRDALGKMIFEDVDGLPIPRMPGVDGVPVAADGAKFHDLANAIGHFGCTEAVLRELHGAALGSRKPVHPFASPVPAAVAADPKAAAALEACARTNDMELKRLRYPELPQEFFDEFVEVCHRRDLDPWCNQIYAGTRHNPRTGLPELAIIVGIEGARIIADRIGGRCGRPKTEYEMDGDRLVAAHTTIIRKIDGEREEFVGSAYLEEYAPPEGTDPLWDRMPRMNLARVSEMAGLRCAYPQDMSRFYTAEEMAQARRRTRQNGRGRSVAIAGEDRFTFDPSTAQD
jgi:phage recombination protein Bet